MAVGSTQDIVNVFCSGIKCDNTSCDFADDTVKFEEYEDWLDKPCPKCGENLLTEEDLAAVIALMEGASIMNEFFGNLDAGIVDSPWVKIPLNLNGTGVIEILPDEEEKP